MEKVLSVAVVCVILFLGFMFYLSFLNYQSTEARRDLCVEAGGINIIGDKGLYKVCLRPEAVIELPRN